VNLNEYISSIGLILGGIGLFLLAVTMITDGLKLAAGNALRNILGSWTRTPKHGIFTGITLTAIVQSSSAVTVATIGFVNAGLLSLYQAVGVIFGANIGTTMTGWLVAIVGFKINIEAFALPLIGIGMLLRLISSNTRYGYFGMALAGFGLFFIGIDVLTGAFEHITASINLQSFATDTILSIFLFVGIGAFMTIITQSSSAAIALTLTAATGGMLELNAAAAMVIGANVGTTSTAALTVIGATPNAKRVAAAHIFFNAVTAGIALLLLPLLFVIINYLVSVLGVNQVPAVTLALFHTTFNVLGVLLMWPIAGWLTRFLEKRFVSSEEVESRPQFLDKNIVKSPNLAVNAAVLELIRISSIVRRISHVSLTWRKGSKEKLLNDQEVVKKLCASVSEFMNLLSKSTLTEEITRQLSVILRIQQHLLITVDLSVELIKDEIELLNESQQKIDIQVKKLRDEVISILDECNIELSDFDIQKCDVHLDAIYSTHDDIKNTLLQINNNMQLPIQKIIEILDRNNVMRRIAKQFIKSTRYLNDLSIETETMMVKSDVVESVNLSASSL
jgi:phosphate:Na+ symporter